MTLTDTVESFDIAIPATALTGAAITLEGRLCLPAPPTGLVLFAHGSGSSRHSPRNASVAAVLHESWLATLRFDLLTEQEATDRVNVFDIALLAERLLAALRQVGAWEQTRHLPVGLFGASTGAAAALVASATKSGRLPPFVSQSTTRSAAIRSIRSLCPSTSTTPRARSPEDSIQR